jgi:hypothetical protein
MPHPFHILLVSWEFPKCPQPFHFSLLHISAHALELQATVWGINSSAPVPPPPQTLCQEPHNNYSYTPLCCHVQNLLFPHSGEVSHIFACDTVWDLSWMHSAKHIPVPLNCSQ